MNIEEMRKTVISHYMENPCLSEEIDYKPDKVRKNHYEKLFYGMSEKEITEEYEVLKYVGLL